MPKALTRNGCTRVRYVAGPGGVVLTVYSSHLWYLMFLCPVSMLLLVFITFRSLLWTATGRAMWKGRRLPRQRVRLV